VRRRTKGWALLSHRGGGFSGTSSSIHECEDPPTEKVEKPLMLPHGGMSGRGGDISSNHETPKPPPQTQKEATDENGRQGGEAPSPEREAQPQLIKLPETRKKSQSVEFSSHVGQMQRKRSHHHPLEGHQFSVTGFGVGGKKNRPQDKTKTGKAGPRSLNRYPPGLTEH